VIYLGSCDIFPEVCDCKFKACGIYCEVCTLRSEALLKRKRDKEQFSSAIYLI